MDPAVIDQLFIDFIGNDIKVIPNCALCQSFQALPAVNSPRRVVGRIDQNRRGPGRDSLFYRSQIQLEILIRIHTYGHSAHQLDNFYIAHPSRHGNNHLVTWIHNSHHRIIQRLFRSR